MKNLAAALLKAQQAIKGVPKDSANQGGTNKSTGKERAAFDYVSVERMVSDARAALHDAGLALMLTSSIVVAADQPLLHQRWMLLHAESGETVELECQMPIVVGPGKPADWATGAASSYGLKYLLRDLLQIPRGLDADATDNSDFDPDAIGEHVYQAELKPLGQASGLSLEKIVEAVGAKHPELRDQHPSRWPKAMLPALKKWLQEVIDSKRPAVDTTHAAAPENPPEAKTGTKNESVKNKLRAGSAAGTKPAVFV